MVLPNRGVKSFSKCAILRIGMLLCDSEVAKEVRIIMEEIKNRSCSLDKLRFFQRVTIAKKYEDSIRAVAKERQAEYFGNRFDSKGKVDSYSMELKSTPMITQNEIAKIAQVSPIRVIPRNNPFK